MDVLPIDGDDPVAFLAPGVLALAVMSTAMVNLAIATGFERQYLVLKRLGATPLGRGRLLGAKTIAIGLVLVVQVVILSVVALLLGWEPDVAGIPLAVAGAVLATIAFAGLGLLMAGTLRGEMTLALANWPYLVLLLLGGMVIPLDELPAAVQAVAEPAPGGAGRRHDRRPHPGRGHRHRARGSCSSSGPWPRRSPPSAGSVGSDAVTARPTLPAALVGDGDPVPCVDGVDRPYLNLDAAASTAALPAVARRGRRRSCRSTPACTAAPATGPGRRPPPTRRPAGGAGASPAATPDGDDVAIFCRNTTEAINHLAYRLQPRPRRRRRDHRRRAPRQPAAVGPAVRPPVRRVRPDGTFTADE